MNQPCLEEQYFLIKQLFEPHDFILKDGESSEFKKKKCRKSDVLILYQLHLFEFMVDKGKCSDVHVACSTIAKKLDIYSLCD